MATTMIAATKAPAHVFSWRECLKFKLKCKKTSRKCLHKKSNVIVINFSCDSRNPRWDLVILCTFCKVVYPINAYVVHFCDCIFLFQKLLLWKSCFTNNFFRAVCLIFLLTSIMLIVILANMVTGVMVQRGICDPLKNPKDNRMFNLVDDLLHVKRLMYPSKPEADINLQHIVM